MKPNTDWLLDLWGYVGGAVLSTVAFLEAQINEHFADAHDTHLERLRSLDRSVIRAMANCWAQEGTQRLPFLVKYDLALALAGKGPLDRGAEPYQSTESLRRLRNALVHAAPEWAIHEGSRQTDDEIHRLAKTLKGRFALNSRVPNNPLYPDQVLSVGCAKWAVQSGVAFADSFFDELGLTAPFGPIRDTLECRLK